MREVGLCVVYVTCLITLYNGTIIPLIRRVEKLESDLYTMKNVIKDMCSELDGIKDDIYINK